MNKHEIINQLLTDYALGELTPQKEAEAQTHLAECRLCRNELKKIESLLEYAEQIKKSSIEEKACESAKKEILEFINNKPSSATHNNIASIFRAITKSPLAKLATAAIIIITAILILHNNSIVSPAFGVEDVIEAMKKVEWMHSTAQVLDDANADPNRIKNELDGLEWWQSINPNRTIAIQPNGQIRFRDVNIGKTWKYDPKSNTITITYQEPSDQESPKNLPDVYLSTVSTFEKKGAQIEYSNGTYEGQPAQIIKFDHTSKSSFQNKMEIIADAKTRLAKQIKLYQKTSNGEESGTILMKIDYPSSGPTDIYQAGAPKDAQIKIIDKRPNPELLEELKPYRDIRDKLVSNYILIAANRDRYDVISNIELVYNENEKQRCERHHVFKPGDPISKTWPIYSVEFGTTFDSILWWVQQCKSSSATIHLYDGEYYYQFERDDAGNWSSKEKRYSPDYNPNPTDLAELGWPIIASSGRIVENEYANTHNFICAETLNEYQIIDGKLRYPAQKNLYYVDPQHDYICRRKEMYAHRRYSVDTPIEKLDFDPNEIPSEPHSITEVTEFGQLDTGQWYPVKIEYRNPSDVSYTKKIYLKTNPEFPAGIFDPNMVIPETELSKTSPRKSYQQIVNEAIVKIDSSESWPQPRELTERYWQARNAKDYDKLAIFWPGSATWNQRIIADEKPIEYVFGEPQKVDDQKVNVPYATKSYYKENDTYNLAMRLTNEKSEKGRYYIISGN